MELINRPGPLKTISQFRIAVPGYVHANSALTEIFYKVYLTRQQNNNNGENLFHYDTYDSSKTYPVVWWVDMFIIRLLIPKQNPRYSVTSARNSP